MSDELQVCMAALFLNKGKDVLTTKEFSMYVSLDLRWMQVKDANALLETLLERGLMSRTGEYLRPAADLSAVNVPIAYRPSEELLRTLKNGSPKQPAGDRSSGLLPKLIQAALDSGLEKSSFISECNRISKRTDVDMEVAALLILRERGTDIAPFMDDVRSSVLGR
ncbi:MAG: DUF2240 family protein [Candidatus Methanoplasma sp.]|jgi:hypothetical protein|nr:DUF2240 family protein [Candidatus Methanoplasma sp.]